MRDRILYGGLIGLVAAAFLTVCAVGYAQQDQPRERGERGARAERGQRPDFRNMSAEDRQKWMEDMQKRRMDGVRQQLGFSEEEWTVVEPLYTKVTTLQTQSSGFGFGGRGMMMGRRGGGRRPGGREGNQDGQQPEQTEVQKTRQALQTTLDNEEATGEQIAKALSDYRAAKTKAAEELATARKALKEVLTPRQEAQCVMMGVLE